MLFHAPARTPDFRSLAAELPTSDRRLIAAHLGVSARTLARWLTGDAPRAAKLAVYWETPLARELLAAHAVEGEHVARALADGLARECATLRQRIARLEETGDFGAANAPTWAAR